MGPGAWLWFGILAALLLPAAFGLGMVYAERRQDRTGPVELGPFVPSLPRPSPRPAYPAWLPAPNRCDELVPADAPDWARGRLCTHPAGHADEHRIAKLRGVAAPPLLYAWQHHDPAKATA